MTVKDTKDTLVTDSPLSTGTSRPRSPMTHHHPPLFRGFIDLSRSYNSAIIMSASIFSTFPPELICRVFQCAADFSVVAALAQTARIFYHTWRENPTSICQAVAPRVFSNLSDAERLLDTQETAEAISQSHDGRVQKSIN
jgi:hypothetical protein